MIEGKAYLDEDVQLMIKTQKGDSQSYSQLYKKYFPIVTCFLISLGAELNVSEDLCQEVFLRIWNNREKYKPASKVKTFFFTYTRNIFFEHIAIAKQRKMFRSIEDAAVLLANLPKTTYHQYDSSDIMKVVEALVSRLPDKQKQVCGLVYLGGASPKQVAVQLGCSLDSVYQSLHYARQSLRKYLKYNKFVKQRN